MTEWKISPQRIRSGKIEWVWKISFNKHSLKAHGPGTVLGATDTVVTQDKIPDPTEFTFSIHKLLLAYSHGGEWNYSPSPLYRIFLHGTLLLLFLSKKIHNKSIQCKPQIHTGLN